MTTAIDWGRVMVLFFMNVIDDRNDKPAARRIRRRNG
jgi:hypothetical protein